MSRLLKSLRCDLKSASPQFVECENASGYNLRFRSTVSRSANAPRNEFEHIVHPVQRRVHFSENVEIRIF